MISLRGYAEKNGVSYEAVRKQVVRYKEELGEHLVVDGRQQFLDDEAVAFLDERRKKNPVVVYEQGWADQVAQLKKKNEEYLEELKDVYKQLATLERSQAQLEAAQQTKLLLEESRDAYKEQAQKAVQEASELNQRVISLEQEKNALQAENEALKKRSWWEVLTKRK